MCWPCVTYPDKVIISFCHIPDYFVMNVSFDDKFSRFLKKLVNTPWSGNVSPDSNYDDFIDPNGTYPARKKLFFCR